MNILTRLAASVLMAVFILSFTTVTIHRPPACTACIVYPL